MTYNYFMTRMKGYGMLFHSSISDSLEPPQESHKLAAFFNKVLDFLIPTMDAPLLAEQRSRISRREGLNVRP